MATVCFTVQYISLLLQLKCHTLAEIKSGIELEVRSNFNEYVSLGFSDNSLVNQMEAYVHQKRYDSDFGDIVPHILARALGLNIIILDTNVNDVVTVSTFMPCVASHNSITIQCKGLHYNGIMQSRNTQTTVNDDVCDFTLNRSCMAVPFWIILLIPSYL